MQVYKKVIEFPYEDEEKAEGGRLPFTQQIQWYMINNVLGILSTLSGEELLYSFFCVKSIFHQDFFCLVLWNPHFHQIFYLFFVPTTTRRSGRKKSWRLSKHFLFIILSIKIVGLCLFLGGASVLFKNKSLEYKKKIRKKERKEEIETKFNWILK